MRTEFCRVNTKDGLRLDGLLFEPEREAKAAVLHLPGRAGNFYANGFLDVMARIYTDNGFALLSVNTRGHDHIADFRVGDTQEIKRIGQAFDIFEECVLDIAAWVEFLKNKGFKKIILQGHSQGAAKLVYFLSKELRPEIVAMVLMSPADAPGLLRKYQPEVFAQNLVLAKEMIRSGRGEDLLPDKIRGWYYISAKTFVNEMSGKEADIFPIFDDGDFGKLENIKVPALAFYGENENTLMYSAQKDLEIIAPHLKNPRSKTFIINGADHTYFEKEGIAARMIVDWLKNILER
jgi:alpha-beta hydrolase superfamily lysophospholipase